MRLRTRLRLPLTAILALALGGAVLTAAHAQQAANLTFEVTENRAPGAGGTGTITALPNNQIRVDVQITGLPPNSEHAAHIHTADGARCDNNAPVTYPLSNIRVDASGAGSSSTTLTLTADKPVQANNAYVNIHTGVTPAGPGLICANVGATFTVAAPAAAASPQAQAASQPPAAAPAQAQPATQAAPVTALAHAGTGDLSDTGSLWLAGALAVLMLLTGAGVAVLAARRR